MSIGIRNSANSNYENTTGRALKTGAKVGLATTAAVKIAPAVKDTFTFAKDNYTKSIQDQKSIVEKFKGMDIAKWYKDKKEGVEKLNSKTIKAALTSPIGTKEQKEHYEKLANDVIEKGKKAAMKELETKKKIGENGAPIKKLAVKESIKETGKKISSKAKEAKDGALKFKEKVVNFAKNSNKDKLATIQRKTTSAKDSILKSGSKISTFLKSGDKIKTLKDHSAQIKKVGIPALIIAGATITATAITKAILNHKAKNQEQ